jgi:hypothetical protein
MLFQCCNDGTVCTPLGYSDKYYGQGKIRWTYFNLSMSFIALAWVNANLFTHANTTMPAMFALISAY